MTKKVFINFLILLLTIFSCSDNQSNEEVSNDPVEQPEIKVAEVSDIEFVNIDVFSAKIDSKVLDNGNASITKRGVCLSTSNNPTVENGKVYIASTVKGSGEFSVTLSDLEEATTYYIRAFATNAAGTGYGSEVSFVTTLANPVEINIAEISVSGAHDIFLDVIISETGDYPILESGVAWGTDIEPTIDVNKQIDRVSGNDNDNDNDNEFKLRITNLEQETDYNVRPYVITDKGVNYGTEVVLSTIKEGDFTYSFNENGADSETVKRIKDAFDEATNYYNNFTSIVKHVTVNYNPGVPTADANLDGWIRVGSNQGYQRTGTALHEMQHTVGGGTHWKWNELLQNGKWQGKRANEIVNMMTDGKEKEVRGDGIHSWPYGINGAHEDTGEEMLYIIHTLIVQGMKTDGLPSN